MSGLVKGEGSLELEENGRFEERLREFRVRGECRVRRMEFRVQGECRVRRRMKRVLRKMYRSKKNEEVL